MSTGPKSSAPNVITIVVEGMGIGDIRAIGEGLKLRSEIVDVQVLTEPQLHRFMGAEKYWPQIVVTFGPAAVYVGKKAADFLMQYIRDTIMQPRGHKPAKVQLFGPDNRVLCEFRTEEYRDYKSYRWSRWRWRWWNRFWWWRQSIKRR